MKKIIANLYQIIIIISGLCLLGTVVYNYIIEKKQPTNYEILFLLIYFIEIRYYNLKEKIDEISK